MKNQNFLIYWLTALVNYGETENSDIMIAKALLSIRHEIGSWSMDRIADEFFVSQAGISRFIRKAGYKSFSEFKTALQESVYTAEKNNPVINRNYEEAVDFVYSKLAPVPEDLKSLKKEDINFILELFEKYENIYFFGSDLSMGIVRLLQMKLVSQGKNAYTIYNIEYQLELLRKLRSEDLVIAVSMGSRWYDILSSKKETDVIKAGDVMLWTVYDGHKSQDKFNYVVFMGHSEEPNLGYHYLMQFVLLLYEMI